MIIDADRCARRSRFYNFEVPLIHSCMRTSNLERKSLFVPVVCLPALDGRWSINVTEEGMGLVARPRRAGDGPFEGEQADLDFPLPSGERIRVRAVVRWRHESAHAQEGLTTSLGVQFEVFEGNGQLELRRFLAEHRLRVVVA